MLDMLEADLVERSSKLKVTQSVEEQGELFRKSLAVHFVTDTQASITQHERRRVMRAVFAHGSARDVAEFKEIWTVETTEKVIKHEKSRPKTDEHRQGLAFLESDDEDDVDGMNLDSTTVKIEDPGSARQTRRKSRNVKSTEENDSVEETSSESVIEAVEAYGGLEAVYLRRRILRLVRHVSTLVAVQELISRCSFAHFVTSLPLLLPLMYCLTSFPSSVDLYPCHFFQLSSCLLVHTHFLVFSTTLFAKSSSDHCYQSRHLVLTRIMLHKRTWRVDI